ncbi:hypothetical protein [Microbulbifer guangxiensis]|uniref:hypothetical protein n=1 Tax=Microbulbifer guangxiensis TaxID=2904249 RepID=UPI001F416ABC|nr:hypothetical protein [Microbulbifer guangxiensis]
MLQTFLPSLSGTAVAIVALLCGCATQQPPGSDTPSTALAPSAHLRMLGEAPEGAGGLQPRSSRLDQVNAVFALDLSGARVHVAPLEIRYRRQSAGSVQPLGWRNRELDASDRQRLQGLAEEAFAQRFLGRRGGRLTPDARTADYTLRLALDDFLLPAPLEQTTRLRQVFTESVAYGTLSGSLYDRQGNLVLEFRDRREFGENFAGPGGTSLQRFSPPAFWADMRMDMRSIFTSLDRSLR